MSGHGRPGAGKRHGSSWLQRMHDKHHKKHRPNVSEEEAEPMLAEENAEELGLPQSRRLAPLRDVVEVASYKTVSFFKTSADYAAATASRAFKKIRRNITPILAALSILLTMASVGIGLGWAVDHNQHHHPQPSNCTCNHSSCTVSQFMMNLAPKNFNPYAYACCGPDQHHAISQINLHALKTTDKHNLADFDMLRSHFHACNNKNFASCGLVALKGITDKIKSKFPIDAQERPLRTAAHSQFIVPAEKKGLTDAMLYMSRMGIANVISFGVIADNPNPDEQVIAVHPPSLSLSRKGYHNKKSMAEWKKTLGMILPIFFDTVPNERCAFARCGSRFSMEDMAEGIMTFEKNLADVEPSEEDLYSPKSGAELEQLMPQLSFAKVLRELAPSGYNASFILIPSPASVQKTSEIIDDTPREILQAYLVWKSVQEYVRG